MANPRVRVPMRIRTASCRRDLACADIPTDATICQMKQTIGMTRSADGTRLAWARSGAGARLVKASKWLTHLEHDLDSPVWKHWVNFLSANFELIRYDERGAGLSERDVANHDFVRRCEDLESVVTATTADSSPFILLGISQGGAVAVEFARRNPEKVSHLILYGAYARGWGKRGDADAERRNRAIVDLIRLG